MFGMRHCGGKWGGGRGWRGHFGPGHGWGGRHGGGNMMRAGRMLAQGDLRLIALALIAEQPRHGYEIIKVLEDKTAGWYSPSPGIVYPTLTYLEENRDFVDAVLERLAFIGERGARMRRRFGDDDDRHGMPPLVRAAIENLREVAAKRLDDDDEAEAKVVEVLARAAAELKKK